MPRRMKSRTRRVRKARTQSKGRSRAQRRTRSRGRKGGASPSYPIPYDIKVQLWEKMMDTYKDHPRLNEADDKFDEMMVYDPEYKSQFTGKSFEGQEDKEYFQGLDKIEAFFKYST